MKKLLALPTLLILVSSLQAMAPATNQPTTATAATGAQAPQKPFKFHLRVPSLARKAAARTSPEVIETEYKRQDEIALALQKAKETGNTKKVAELEKKLKLIPIDVFKYAKEAHAMPEDPHEKISYALEMDDPDLLILAMGKKTVTIQIFDGLVQKTLQWLNAKNSLNFLLSHAENIPLETLNKFLILADDRMAPTAIRQLLMDRVMVDTEKKPHGSFFDKWDQFPLHKAIIENRLEDVANRIKDNVNVNMIANGLTPLLLACIYGNYPIAKLLIKHNADVNIEGRGLTALMIASLNDHTDLAKLLIKHEAKINAASREGFTALMIASEYGNTAVAQLLIDKGANVNATNYRGNTALMIASEYGHTEIVKLLIDHGANVNAKNNSEKTARDIAEEENHPAIVALLSKKPTIDKPAAQTEIETDTEAEFETDVEAEFE